MKDFLNAMLAADVAFTTTVTDTPAARAMRAVIHLTTEAGKAMLEGSPINAEWRQSMQEAAAILTPMPSPFLSTQPKPDEIPCNEL